MRTHEKTAGVRPDLDSRQNATPDTGGGILAELRALRQDLAWWKKALTNAFEEADGPEEFYYQLAIELTSGKESKDPATTSKHQGKYPVNGCTTGMVNESHAVTEEAPEPPCNPHGFVDAGHRKVVYLGADGGVEQETALPTKTPAGEPDHPGIAPDPVTPKRGHADKVLESAIAELLEGKWTFEVHCRRS